MHSCGKMCVCMWVVRSSGGQHVRDANSCCIGVKVPGITDEEKLSVALMANYNLAEFIRDRLVPRVTLFYTGDAVDEEDDEDDCSVSSVVIVVGGV